MESSTVEKHTPPPSPLLSLPAELLSDIFDQAYEEAKPSEPLCRALLPLYLTLLYRRMEIMSYRRLTLLRRAIKSQTNLGKVVKTFKMDFEGEVLSENSTTAVKFASFLSLLPQLRQLALHHAAPALLHTLLHILAESRAPLPYRLDLTPNSDEDIDETDWHAALRHCPSLTTLHLDTSSRRGNFLVSSPAPLSTTLVELYLSDHAWSDIEPFPLHTLFPALTHLTLVDTESDPAFANVLKVAATTLKSLVLQRTASDYDDEVYDFYLLDDILPRCTQLEHLELCEFSFTPDLLLHHFRSLSSLSSLTFGPAAPITDDFLLSLVEASTYLRHLRTLTLNYVSNTRGPTFEDEGYCLSDEADETFGHVYPGWEVPLWKWACDGDGLACVLSAAEDRGIEVEGTALGAETWSEDFAEERHTCTMEWCYNEWNFRGGMFREAIDAYGEDEVRRWMTYLDDDGFAERDVFGESESEESSGGSEVDEGSSPLCL